MSLWKDSTIKSEFNGEVKLKKFFGRYSVWVGGFEQSGPLVEKLWQQAFKGDSLLWQGVTLRNVLILGLGCGSVLAPLFKKYPQVKVTGIEIDPVMIEIGKKYFNLQTPNLKILCHDATKLKLNIKFDLIISDLYRNGDIIFDPGISKNLSPNGQIILNYLKFGKSKEEKKKFVDFLRTKLVITKTISAEYNDLFVCSP